MRRQKPKTDPDTADLSSVRRAGMDLLARREHSRAELRRKLTERGLPDELVDQAVETLADEGLQSDERYAEAFVHSRVGRGQGPLRIRQELRARGVADGLVAATLDEGDREAWRERAERARRQRFGEAAPADWASKVKQAKFLQQRGFAMDHIQLDVVEE